MADEKGLNALSMKVKIALLTLCPLLIIGVCSAVIMLYAGSMVDEGVYTPPEAVPVYASVAPSNAEEARKAVNTLLTDAQQSGEVKITGTDSVDLFELTSELTEAQKNILTFAAGSIESGMAGSLQPQTLAYGEKAELFPLLTDETVTFTDDAENRLFLFEAQVKNAYENADAALFASAKEAFLPVLTVENESVTLLESKAVFTADPITNRLQNVTYTRNYQLEYTVNFTGDLAALGTQTFAFKACLTRTFDIRWAGISIGQDRIVLHKNGYEALSLSVNKETDAPYELTFASSDASVATVDESGVVEAVQCSDKPITVTATLTYLGKTYTDTCEVLVIIEPESVQMHSKAQTLRVGESVQLDAVVKPDKATVKTLTWYSPDESVATVDENGLVTAVGEGTVQIIAVSTVGDFMAGCSITVEGGGN